MTARKHNLVVGVFDHLPPAEQAIQDLWQAGFAHDRIDMVTRSQGVTEGTPRFERDKDAATGALTGAAVGAAAGVVAGALTAVLVPGVGTILGGGLLAGAIGAIGGGTLGAAGGTFVGPFIALAMSPDEAHYYAKEIDEGRTVVLVQTVDRAAEARDILRRHGARENQGTPGAGTPA
jgi:hypothetical protein